tara:strand:- start:285 stop:680 length:396 start_codon:yes stop_codon:yes gene_type:complete
MIKGVFNKILSVILLVIYCITISPYFLFHNHDHHHSHNHDHHHSHNHELSNCEYALQKANNTKNCSHQSHILNLKHKCHICDYVSYFDKAICAKALNFSIAFLNIDILQISYCLLLDDNTIYLNKSPPYLS